MKYVGLALFVIVLAISITIMLVPVVAYYSSVAFFGLPIWVISLFADISSGSSGSDGSAAVTQLTAYGQVVGCSFIPTLPILLWGCFVVDNDTGGNDFFEKLAEFFANTFWLVLVLVIGLLIGMYVWLANSSALSEIQLVSTDDVFSDFINNFVTVYCWYIYPIVHIGAVVLSLFLSTKCESIAGQIIVFLVLGIVTVTIVPFVFYFLFILLGAILLIVLPILAFIGFGIYLRIVSGPRADYEGKIKSDGTIEIYKNDKD